MTFKSLKSYGILLNDLEDLVQSEVEDFMEILMNTEGEPIDPRENLRTTLCCIISSLVEFSKDIDTYR